MAPNYLQTVAQTLTLAALLFASATDIRRRIIPNACVVAVMVAFVLKTCAAASTPLSALHTLAVGAAHGALVGCLLLVPEAFLGNGGEKGAVGAGDIKLFSALAMGAPVLGGMVLVAFSCVLGVAAKGVELACARAWVCAKGRFHAAVVGPQSNEPQLEYAALVPEGIRMAPAITLSYILLQLLSALLA